MFNPLQKVIKNKALQNMRPLGLSAKGNTPTNNNNRLPSLDGLEDKQMGAMSVKNPATRKMGASKEQRDLAKNNFRSYGMSGADKSYIDPQVEEYLRSLFGDIDTSGEEAMLRRQFQNAQGQALADANAQGAFGGMGMLGAQLGVNADIQRNMSDQLMEQILGVRRDARQESFDRARTAIDQFGQESNRQFGSDEAQKDRDFRGGQADKDRAIDQQRYQNELAMLAAALKDMGITLNVSEDGKISIDDSSNSDVPQSAQDQNRANADKEAEYSSLPTGDRNPSIFGGSDADYGSVKMDEYIGSDGKRWEVWRAPDGTIYRNEVGWFGD